MFVYFVEQYLGLSVDLFFCGFAILWSPYVKGQTIYIFILSFVTP